MASANDNFGRQHVIPKSKKEKKPNIVIKNNAKLSAASGEELVHENVEAALRRLFSNPTYAPLDPFKCMIFSLRRKERSQELSTRRTTLPSSTTRHINSSTIPLVKFGASAGVGFKHLAKLLSVVAIRRLCMVLDGLRKALGSFPLHVKKPSSTSDFIETATINSCLAGNVAIPRPHLIETVVEAVIEAKDLDAALDIFIRRVVDEGFAAEKSPAIVSAQINVLMSGRSAHVTPFRVSEIHAKTRQVLSAMKTAVVDNGDIYLELFFRVCRVLPSFTPDSDDQAEPSMGFVKILRRYHFSFRDSSSRQCRCFAKYPFETLARNMFFNMDQARAYRECYDSHCARMKLADTADPREVLMDNVLVNMARQAWGALAAGELVVAAEWLLQLAAILFPGELRCTGAITPVSFLLTHTTGFLRAARDSCVGLKMLMTTIADSITQNAELLQEYYSSNGGGITRELVDGEWEVVYFRTSCTITEDEDRNTIKALHSQYATIAHAILEVRTVLLSLLRDGRSSELSYLTGYVLQLLLRLFNNSDHVNPVIPSDPFLLSKKSGLLGVAPFLEEAAVPLHQLSTCLHMLELSVGTDILFELLEEEHGVVLGRSLPTRSVSGKSINEPKGKGGLFGAQTEQSEEETAQRIPINMVPMNLSELLGYAKTISQHKTLSSSLLWSPMQPSELLNPFVTPASSRVHVSLTKAAVGRSILFETEDAGLFTGYTPSGLAGCSPHPGVPTCWELCAQLNQNSLSRFGCVDIPTAMHNEDKRYDIPRFMSKDGIRMRYMMEAHLYRALHEALVQVRLQPRTVSPYAVISSHLFPFSSNLQLWRVEDELLLYNIFAAHSLGLVRVFRHCSHVSKLLVPGVNTLKDIKENEARHEQGKFAGTLTPLLFGSTGIYGPASVLSGIGGYLLPAGYSNDDSNDYIKSTIKPKNRNVIYADISMAAKIFKLVWSIPPLLASPPPSPQGVKLEVCSGMSVATAIGWGWNWNHSDSRYKIVDACIEEEAPPPEDGSWFSFGKEPAPPPKPVVDTSAPPQSSFFTSPYNDLGCLDYPGELELEVVYSASYSHPDLVPALRSMFGKEVMKCCKMLCKQPQWRLFDMVVSERKYPISYVATTDSEAMASAMLKALTKHGTGTLYGAVALPDLITENILGEKVSADDINDEESILRKQEWNRANNQRLVSLDKILNVLRSVSEERQNASVEVTDPCGDDLGRIMSDSSGMAPTPVQRVQEDSAAAAVMKDTGLGSTAVPPAVRCYVPFKISLSLIGTCTQSVKVTKKAMLKKRTHVGNLTVGGQTAGERGTFARLLTSTVWFSTVAAHSIWDGLKVYNYKGREDTKASDFDADLLFNTEATRQWQLFRRLEREDVVAAYRHAAVYVLVVNQPQYASALCRMLNSLPAQLHKTMACINLTRQILSRDSFTSVNQRSLGHTIVRHICLALRLVVTSPRCVHLVGGGYLVLKDIEQLELVLGLGRIPLCEAGFGPTPHQPGHEKTPHSAWGHSSASHASNRGLGVTLPLPVGIKENAGEPKLSGEASLSRKLELRENVLQAVSILADLHGACSVLYEALCRDVRGLCESHLDQLLNSPPTDAHPFLIHHTPVPPPAAPTSERGETQAPEQPEYGLYVSRRVLRERAAREARPRVRMNVNAMADAVTEGVGEDALDPFRLLQKITDIASNIKKTELAEVEGPPVEIEGADPAESRLGTALEDESLDEGLGGDLKLSGSVSSLESITEAGGEGDESSDTDEEVHVGMMFKRKFDARRAEADRWLNVLKNAKEAEDRDDILTENGGSRGAVFSAGAMSTGGSMPPSASAASRMSSISGGGGGLGSLFKNKLKGKLGALKTFKARGGAGSTEEYVRPAEAERNRNAWLRRQQEAVLVEEEGLELFLHGGAANLPPPEPERPPPCLQNRPDVIGFRIEEPVTREYNRWASRTDDSDMQHVEYDDEDEEEDEHGQVVHARARPPSMLKLLRLQTEYASMDAGALVAPMPGSEAHMSDASLSFGLNDSQSLFSLETAGTRDRSIKFFDTAAGKVAAANAEKDNRYGGVLQKDYQRFAILAAAQRRQEAARTTPTDDSLAVLDNLRESSDYKG